MDYYHCLADGLPSAGKGIAGADYSCGDTRIWLRSQARSWALTGGNDPNLT